MKPRLFIASSKEAVDIASAVHANLQRTLEVTVWTHGLVKPSTTPLQSIWDESDTFDFALFLMSPDDVVLMRDLEQPAARDNVIFELGLFVGRLGVERCFLLVPQDGALHLPTDLVGLTPLEYETGRADDNWRASTGPASMGIQAAVGRLGPRERQEDQTEPAGPKVTQEESDLDPKIEDVEDSLDPPEEWLLAVVRKDCRVPSLTSMSRSVRL